jgi:ADP-L-glycero-D-manno-heptose 6-epimerase
MSRRTVVVTGAAGFIGRNVVAALNRRGQANLLLVDHLGTDEKWKNLMGLEFDDIISPAAFLKLIDGEDTPSFDGIIHLGACSATTERDADYLLENNYRYTRRLCTWCLEHECRFVYASSAATYGDGSRGFLDDEDSTLNLRPLNMYGYSKHLFDLWAIRAGPISRIAGLKYFNVYGPHEDHKEDMRSVVHKAYAQILREGKVQLFKSYRDDYPDGGQKRDFIYVTDAVDVTLYLLDHREVGGLFNCGTGHARTWEDLAKALFRAMNREPKIEFIDMPEALQPKYQYFTQAAMEKLREAGYTRPFTSLEDGVAAYVRDHLALPG